MEIQITRSDAGCVATIDGEEIATADTLEAIHIAIKEHLGRPADPTQAPPPKKAKAKKAKA